jgi:hypothetical protein
VASFVGWLAPCLRGLGAATVRARDSNECSGTIDGRLPGVCSSTTWFAPFQQAAIPSHLESRLPCTHMHTPGGWVGSRVR